MLNVFGRGFDQTRVAFARKGKIELVVVNIHETTIEALTLLERTIPKNIPLANKLMGDPHPI